LLLTETGGVWSTGVEATLPADGVQNHRVFLTSVSCGAAGDCGAVGEDSDATSGTHEAGLLLTETNGAWGAASEPILPGNADPSASGIPSSVSCPAAGECSASGIYKDTNDEGQGL